ncbi:MAG: OB-fold nucleic acid binding domain-containing protein, partial [Actinomycetota bacterium]
MNPFRTHFTADLDASNVGEDVQVAGWVLRRRDHGGIAFLDIRDGQGIVQVVVDPANLPQVNELRMEYTVAVAGEVSPRPEGTVNPDLATGEIEIHARELDPLSPADPLPFMLDDRTEIEERLRLRYRYLDLRRPRMAENLRARSRA